MRLANLLFNICRLQSFYIFLYGQEAALLRPSPQSSETMRACTIFSLMLPIGAALAAVAEAPTGTVLPLTAVIPSATSVPGLAAGLPPSFHLVSVGDANTKPVFDPPVVNAVSGDTILFGL